MKKITIPNALPIAGHYSSAIESKGLIFISGILPIDPFTGKKLSDAPFTAQVIRVLDNLALILEAAGSSLNKMVKVNVYVNDISQWEEFNRIYKERLGDHKPARAVVPVGKLHFDLALELEGVAEA